MLLGVNPYGVLAAGSAVSIPLTLYLAQSHCSDVRCVLGMYAGVVAYLAWVGAYLLRFVVDYPDAGVALSLGGACLAMVFLGTVYRYYPTVVTRREKAVQVG